MRASRSILFAAVAAVPIAISSDGFAGRGNVAVETMRIREVLQRAHRLSEMGKLGRFERLTRWDFSRFNGNHIRHIFEARRRRAHFASLRDYLDFVLSPSQPGIVELQTVAGFFAVSTVVSGDVSWPLDLHDSVYAPAHQLIARALRERPEHRRPLFLRAFGLGADAAELKLLIDLIAAQAQLAGIEPRSLVDGSNLRLTLDDLDPGVLETAERLLVQ